MKKFIDTMEYPMMNKRGEHALYWRWMWSRNRCTAAQCILAQVWA